MAWRYSVPVGAQPRLERWKEQLHRSRHMGQRQSAGARQAAQGGERQQGQGWSRHTPAVQLHVAYCLPGQQRMVQLRAACPPSPAPHFRKQRTRVGVCLVHMLAVPHEQAVAAEHALCGSRGWEVWGRRVSPARACNRPNIGSNPQSQAWRAARQGRGPRTCCCIAINPAAQALDSHGTSRFKGPHAPSATRSRSSRCACPASSAGTGGTSGRSPAGSGGGCEGGHQLGRMHPTTGSTQSMHTGK